jgi:CheY-like chemotaxis protein
MSGCHDGQADDGIIAQRSDGFQTHVAGTLDGPFVVLFEQQGADQADDRGLVREDALGYRAEAASNGSEALERVMADGYDAVLTDVVMPDMNGFQLAERIQAIRPDLPVICVTGHADVADDPGYCYVVLQKPYGTATLARMLARVLPPEARA